MYVWWMCVVCDMRVCVGFVCVCNGDEFLCNREELECDICVNEENE